MRQLRDIQPVAWRCNVDSVGIDAGDRPGSSAPDQGPADMGCKTVTLTLDPPCRPRVGRGVGPGERCRHGLAFAEFAESEHVARAEIDPECAVAAGLQLELER